VYQSNSNYTVITFTYNGAEIALPDIYFTRENTVLDFRVQAVTGYFNVGTRPQYFEAVYEGEGSAYTEFSVKIPPIDEPGTSKPNVQPSSVAPSTSNPNTSPTSNTNSPSDIPSTSDPYNPPSQPPWTTNLIITILATVCILTIPLVIIAYQYGKRKTNLRPNNLLTDTLLTLFTPLKIKQNSRA